MKKKKKNFNSSGKCLIKEERREKIGRWISNMIMIMCIIGMISIIGISIFESIKGGGSNQMPRIRTQGIVIKKFSEEEINVYTYYYMNISTNYFLVLEFEHGGIKKWNSVRVSKKEFDEINVDDVLDISVYWSNRNYDIKLLR